MCGALPGHHPGLAAAQASDPFPDVGLQLGERVEFRGLGGEVVVGLGQHPGLNFGHRDAEGQGAVLLGVVGLKLQDVARRCATQVLVDLGDHRAGAYLVQVAARRQAFDRLVVESAIDVDGDLVAVVSWTLHRFQRGVLTTEGV